MARSQRLCRDHRAALYFIGGLAAGRFSLQFSGAILHHAMLEWGTGVTECAGEIPSALEVEGSPGAETQEFLAGTSS